ncbi:diadenylate cyclase [Humidesulfovibrio idahonensis]
MDTCIFKSDSPFIVALQANVEVANAEGAEKADRAAALLADAEQLSQLCTACFWASLEVEEGREVRGTISICSPESVQLARAFTHPVPVTVRDLVALLTASPRTPLAVHGGPEGLHVWGMLDAEPEGLLRLRIAGNGILLASRARRVLALLNQGVMSIPVAADEISLSQLVARTLGKERYLEEHGNAPARFIRVVTTMIRHGHGGTLVLVSPEDQSWRAGVSFRFCFDEESGRLLQHSVRDFESGMNEALRGYDDLVAGRANCASLTDLREQYDAVNYLRTLSESLFRRVGDLGLIDGAVVMDMDLMLHGFGAKLLFGPEEFTVTTLNAVTGRVREDVPLAALGGMRHQSAARFVQANRETDAFVISQDGRLSMISWSELTQTVAVVQNMEHFIWEYRTF